MIRNKWLYDPVERTKTMQDSEFTKYVNLREAQLETKKPTGDGIMTEIKTRFYDSHAEVYTGFLDFIWDFARPKLEKNLGLAQFTLDYGGAESDFFFPWLLEIQRSPSGALEMAYGAGHDLIGLWKNSVPETDPIDFFVRNDPTFVYNRERQLFVADLVTTTQDWYYKGRKSKVIDLGAGRLAWARWHGFKFSPGCQEIYALDRDPHIHPDELFELQPESYSLHYHIGKNAMEELASPRYANADLIMLGGVASYYPLEVFKRTVILPAYQLLNAGGVFFFDLQLDCPYYRRSMRIFDWPEMKLSGTPTDAIDRVEMLRKSLWADGCRFSAEYALDTYNPTPSAVMITFSKL